MQVKQFVFNHFEVNCYVLWDAQTLQCAIIDPAAYTAGEQAELFDYIDSHHLTPERILLTHTHVDHVAGLQAACQRYRLPVSLHHDGVALLGQAHLAAVPMGFNLSPFKDITTECVEPNARIVIGINEIECRHVPGHCPGSLCFVLHADKKVFTGDALFHLSVGRTDLPGGDMSLLIDKIHQELLSLSDDYEVLPGHSIASNIGKERKHNFFLKNNDC